MLQLLPISGFIILTSINNIKRDTMKPNFLRLFTVSILIITRTIINAQPPGMYVTDRFLFSSSGDTVILKGFNAMIVYWDIHGNVNFPQIEKTGANCVRIFWKLDSPIPQPSDLDLVLSNCIDHNMIPIICLWDATGDWSKIQQCVNYWCSAAITSIFKKYEKHLIINIANEPGSEARGDPDFRDTYSAAVLQMRNAGLHVPLMIDADRWGRNADAVLDNGEYLVQQDPDHDLILSWHLWDPNNYGTGTTAEIDRIITKATTKNICFIVGEFGPCENCSNCTGTKISWEYLIEKAYKNKIGYLPWVWKWSDCHSVVNNNTGSYGSWVNPPWGESVAFLSPYSIKRTAKRPSEFQTGIEDIPSDNELITVKPNPFSGEVEFSVCMEKAGAVALNIFDMQGRQLANFIEEPFPAGIATFRLNERNVINLEGENILVYKLLIRNASGMITRTGKIIKI